MCRAIVLGSDPHRTSGENLQFDHSSHGCPTLPEPSKAPPAPMKLHADRHDTLAITAYGEGWIAVNGQRYEHSVVVSSSGRVEPWGCRHVEELTADHFTGLPTGDPAPPELVVFGSGSRLRFVSPALLAELTARRIGVETMDTRAACRTYNILAAEGRRVIAALILGAQGEHPDPGSG